MNFRAIWTVAILTISITSWAENRPKGKACYTATTGEQLSLFKDLPPNPELYDSIPKDNKIRVEGSLWIETDFLMSGYFKNAQSTYLVNKHDNRVNQFANSLTMSIDQPGHPTILALERIYFSAKFEGLEFELPHWVRPNHIPDFVRGKGIPLTILEMLHQMKRFGIQPGQLQKAFIREVFNVDMLLNFGAVKRRWALEHPDEYLTAAKAGELLQDVPLVRNFITALNLAGHRVTRIGVVGSGTTSVKLAIKNYADLYPEFRAKWEALARMLGLKETDQIKDNLLVQFDLEKFD